MLHLGTIAKGFREFVAFVCIANPPGTSIWNSKVGKVYIEEAVLEAKDYSKDVFGHLKFINDDEAQELAAFANSHNLLNIREIIYKVTTHPKYQHIRKVMFPLS
jgi:hypothetical protein